MISPPRPRMVRRIEFRPKTIGCQYPLTAILEKYLYRTHLNECNYYVHGDWEVLINEKLKVEIKNEEVHFEIFAAKFEEMQKALETLQRISCIDLFFYSEEKHMWIVDLKIDLKHNCEGFYLDNFNRMFECFK